MTSTSPRIAFMGTPEFAASALASLIEGGCKPVVVYSQPPRPAGRGQQLQKSPVQLLAESHDIPVRHPVNFKSAQDVQEFQNWNLDLAVVAAYGLLLPQSILDAPKMGCVNIHASLLPRWRGAAPIQRAILAGDRDTGICLMQMDIGLDTGAVYSRESIAISPDMNAGQLHDALAALGATMIVRDLPKILAGQLSAIPQAGEANYAAKIKKQESKIDWQKPAVEIERQIRAFAPFPGAYFEYNGERIKIFAATIFPVNAAPGTVLENGMIACGAGAIQPTQLQRAGKNIVSAKEFWRGMKIADGAKL